MKNLWICGGQSKSQKNSFVNKNKKIKNTWPILGNGLFSHLMKTSENLQDILNDTSGIK